jgi:hypothetical protein
MDITQKTIAFVLFVGWDCGAPLGFTAGGTIAFFTVSFIFIVDTNGRPFTQFTDSL